MGTRLSLKLTINMLIHGARLLRVRTMFSIGGEQEGDTGTFLSDMQAHEEAQLVFLYCS